MRVYVESYGCTQNLGEGRALERAVRAAGHEVVAAPSGADVGVLVTCGVIGPTEARMVRRYRALLAALPEVVVTGCLVPLRGELFGGEGAARTTFLPTRDQGSLPALLDRSKPRDARSLAPPAPGPNPEPGVVEEVVLAQGCTSHCTYCYSRLARGPLRSVGREELLTQIDTAQRAGAREIRLASLDTACWGADRSDGYRLPDLLRDVAALPGGFRVRLGMMSPQSLRPIADDYFDALAAERFFRFLHLPLQSGSDTVLAAMRRGYSVRDFLETVERARHRLPEVMLATDVIVGFPTESDVDFEATLDLIARVEPEIVNVTRFSARPLTPAHRLRPLPTPLVKERSRRLTELRTRTARRRMERAIGRIAPAVVVERGPNGSSVARLPNYLPVVLSDRHPLGDWLEVRVDGARSTYLLGASLGAHRPPTAGAVPAFAPLPMARAG